MNEDVFRVFPSFSTQFEGRVNHMYLDVKGLVTIGIGNLIDPVSKALEEHRKYGPFVDHWTGRSASETDVVHDFERVKHDVSLKQGGHRAARHVARLDLSESSIDALVTGKALAFAAEVKKWPAFSEVESWPPDAQLALLSMAWAMGPSFGPKWPKFSSACASRSWDSAAENCRMRDEQNPGLRPRNTANQTLFANAAFVQREAPGLDAVVYVVSGERPTLREGSTGYHVAYLQQRLQDLEYLAAANEVFDGQTVGAVQQFQANSGLVDDGIVGANSWAALGAVTPRSWFE